MKPDDFDKDLRDLAGSFTLPVQNDFFAQMMLARRKKRRRAIMFYLCGLAAALIVLLTFMYSEGTDQDAELKQPLASTEMPQQNNRVLPGKKPHEAGLKETIYSSNTTATTDKPETSKPAIRNPAILKPETKDQPGAEKITAGNRLNRLNTLPVIKEQTPLEIPLTDMRAQQAEPVKEPFAVVVQTTDTSFTQDTMPDPGLAFIVDSVTPASGNGEQPKIKAESTRRIEAGVYAHYFAITNAVNASSLIPLNKPDSFGLNEKANYAFSAGVKGSYQLSAKWKIILGIGINKLQFDKIRIAQTKVDSLTAYEITNVKALRAFNQNITEQSFTWLEIPLGVGYTLPLSGKISFCTEAGLVYQTLLQNKAYEFTTSSDGELSYKEMNNIGQERLTKNTLAFYLQPGISTAITKRMSLFTGLSYRNQFTSYYKKEYFPTGSVYFIGATAHFTYKF
ncbi:MAG: hypothetical protein V4658_12605 [Bacteroidota bacterium]